MNSLDYLLSFQRFGIKLGLDNITFLLRQTGDPHHNFPSIHVTGTNGKGSVVAFIHSVLMSMGYRVGRYISPHLVDFSERILVNNTPISPSEIEQLVDELRPIIDSMLKDTNLGHPTFFEAVTAMAFQHFFRHKVDIAVVEVGMGGRYDSTNVIQPCLSIITNVNMEHKEYLGDTLEKIAIEKAGIIKPTVEVVSAVDQPEVRKIIDDKAEKYGSAVYYLSRDFHVEARRGDFPRQWVDFSSPQKKLKDVEINLAGDFQVKNAAVALMGLEILGRKGVTLQDENALRSGMAQARWPARLEKLADSPTLVLDGGHNPSGVRSLVNAIRELFPRKRFVLVLAMLADKDVTECLRTLRELTNSIIVTRCTYERAMPADQLARLASGIFENVRCEPSIAAALKEAYTLAKPNDVILATGSLFNVAEVMKFVSDRLTKRAHP